MNARFSKQIVRMEEVLSRTGLSRSMVYKLQRQEAFPRPIPLGDRAVGWYEEDIDRWLSQRGSSRSGSPDLPMVYMAGRMGEPEDNKRPGGSMSCWRLFDVSESDTQGTLEADNSPTEVLIAPPEERAFHGSSVRFMYSGPWKASGSNHGYLHGITSCSPDMAHNAAYRGALQGIARADVVVAYLEDLKAFGTLVEIGYARASNKKVIVVTAPQLAVPPLGDPYTSQVWFATHAADRHIELPTLRNATQQDYWRAAHAHVAAVLAEWYPRAAQL